MMINRIATAALLCAAQPAFAQDWNVDVGMFTLDTRTIQHEEIGPKAWLKMSTRTDEGTLFIDVEVQAACDVPLIASYQMVIHSDYSDKVIQKDIDVDEMFASPSDGEWQQAFFDYVCK